MESQINNYENFENITKKKLFSLVHVKKNPRLHTR